MITRILAGRALAAVAGVAMLAATATSASAFTLSSQSLEPSVASSDTANVYWHGHWHGGWHRHWGGGGWGWHHHRHCWVNPWGHLRCGW